MSKFNAVGAGVKWGASKVKSIFTGGKQKTTGTEVIKKFSPLKKFKGQKSASDVKFSGALKKFSQDVSNISTETVSKLGQIEQKMTGKPVTKSGWSKGKNIKK